MEIGKTPNLISYLYLIVFRFRLLEKKLTGSQKGEVAVKAGGRLSIGQTAFR